MLLFILMISLPFAFITDHEVCSSCRHFWLAYCIFCQGMFLHQLFYCFICYFLAIILAWNDMKDAMMLYAGRVLLGYCTGVLSYVVSIYSSQYAPEFFIFLKLCLDNGNVSQPLQNSKSLHTAFRTFLRFCFI